MAKNEKLYDMPFERRIRIKYMSFGLVTGLSMVGVLALLDMIGLIVASMFVPIEAFEIKLKGVINFAVFALFAPLAWWMWYSKAKPKRHPELNETVGLKDDYDRVKTL